MRCKKCNKNRKPSEFNKGRSTCKKCDRAVAKEYARKKREQAWAERKPIIDHYLGTRCVVCGKEIYSLLRCHQIYGNHHKPLLETPVDEVRRNCESGIFVRVCASCHGKTHALMEKGITNWLEIVVIIREFLATSPPSDTDRHLRAWHKWRDKRLTLERQLALADLTLSKEVFITFLLSDTNTSESIL